jgi:protein TonB
VNALSLDYGYQPRDPSGRFKGLLIVIALHALLAYALVTGTARKGLNFLKKPLEAVVIQEVILPPPPPPPPPVTKVVKPLDALAPRTEVAPVPVPLEVPPAPVTNVVEISNRDLPLPSRPAPVIVATPAPASDHIKAQAASMEAEYAAMVRAMLNSIKRYPTGRAASQQRPQGKVKVWFTLARGGALLDAGILDSSNVNLLDDAALATVRRGKYPPFPTNTWADQESHKFSAEIEFNPPSN